MIKKLPVMNIKIKVIFTVIHFLYTHQMEYTFQLANTNSILVFNCNMIYQVHLNISGMNKDTEIVTQKLNINYGRV